MLWLKLGWRNLWRAPRRTMIELSSIAGAVFLGMTMANLQTGSYEKLIEEGTRMGSGQVGFYREGYLEQRRLGQTFPVRRLAEALEGDSRVRSAFARLYVPGLARSSRDSRGAVLLGLDIDLEREVNPLLRPKHIVEGELPGPGERWKAVLGVRLAKELGLKLGSKFVWMSQDDRGEMASRLFRVAALARTGVTELDQGAVLVRRPDAAALLGGEDQAHELAVLLEDPRGTAGFLPTARELAAGLPDVRAVPWQEAMPEIADGIRIDRTSGYFFLGFILLLVAIGTANTMLMSVLERQREFGVVRALGLDRAGIVRMVLAEGLVLGACGCALGVAAGAAAGLHLSTRGLDFSPLMGEGYEFGGVMMESVIYAAWDWGRTWAVAAAMALLAVAASVYPTWRALRIHPAEAMRSY